MSNYKELKSAKYKEETLQFIDELLGISFNQTSSYCPFHKDTDPSFRIYEKNGEIRFHCFGTCDSDWDIYDVIGKKRGCSFPEAHKLFADYLRVDIDSSNTFSPPEIPVEKVKEPEESPVIFNEPKELSQEVIAALEDAAKFYNNLLIDGEEKFPEVYRYLERRGVDNDLIKRYQIGFTPPFKNEEYEGRALLNHHLENFSKDYLEFNHFNRASLFRLLNDSSSKSTEYYRRFCDFSPKYGIYGVFSDYFTGRLTFPIYNVKGRACGFMGRKLDNRGIKWLKQKTVDTDLNPKGWLYGIDKAYKFIQRYQTVILVEGIFDYFAFLKIHQDQSKPIVISTLGAKLTEEALSILIDLKVKKIVVAYDWDDAGKRAIRRIAEEVSATVYHLGGMEDGQDPAEKLKPVENAIGGFSLSRLMDGAEKAQELTDKRVCISFITSGKQQEREVLFAPINDSCIVSSVPSKNPKQYVYDVDDFLHLLSYDHPNITMLRAKINALVKLLKEKPSHTNAEKQFTIPVNFFKESSVEKLGPALILWLKIVIEQQTRKRRLKITDSCLADDLRTSRTTVSKYKAQLKSLNYLNSQGGSKIQKLSVKYFTN